MILHCLLFAEVLLKAQYKNADVFCQMNPPAVAVAKDDSEAQGYIDQVGKSIVTATKTSSSITPSKIGKFTITKSQKEGSGVLVEFYIDKGKVYKAFVDKKINLIDVTESNLEYFMNLLDNKDDIFQEALVVGVPLKQSQSREQSWRGESQELSQTREQSGGNKNLTRLRQKLSSYSADLAGKEQDFAKKLIKILSTQKQGTKIFLGDEELFAEVLKFSEERCNKLIEFIRNPYLDPNTGEKKSVKDPNQKEKIVLWISENIKELDWLLANQLLDVIKKRGLSKTAESLLEEDINPLLKSRGLKLKFTPFNNLEMSRFSVPQTKLDHNARVDGGSPNAKDPQAGNGLSQDSAYIIPKQEKNSSKEASHMNFEKKINL